jgi:hypothetical protein
MAKIAELRGLSTEQVVEAANAVLASRLGVDDPAEAPNRLAALAGLDPGKAVEIASLARKAAESDPKLLGELLAGSLDDLAESEPQDREAIVQAAEAAGEKQTVVGLDILALGYLLLCAYVIVRNRGVTEEERTVKIKEQKDGRLELTIGEKKKILNPLSPLGNLLGSIWPKAGG